MTWQPEPGDIPPAEAALHRPMMIRPPVVIPPRADTKQVSALQLLPLLPILITLLGTFPYGWNTTTLGCAVVATALIQYLFARADRRALRSRGFLSLAPAALALVSSAWYLHVRARHCNEHDPSAGDAVIWSIVTTVAAVMVGAMGTLFAWGVGGLFEMLGTSR